MAPTTSRRHGRVLGGGAWPQLSPIAREKDRLMIQYNSVWSLHSYPTLIEQDKIELPLSLSLGRLVWSMFRRKIVQPI